MVWLQSARIPSVEKPGGRGKHPLPSSTVHVMKNALISEGQDIRHLHVEGNEETIKDFDDVLN